MKSRNNFETQGGRSKGVFALTMPILHKQEVDKLMNDILLLITLTEGSRVYKYQALIRALRCYRSLLIQKAKEMGINLSLYKINEV